MSNEKPIIELFDFDGLGLIVIFPSGVIYTNQVGGYACLHPEIEGIFVPLPVRHKKILFGLQSHFNGNWNHLEKSDSKVVDKLFRNEGFEFLTVDQSNLENSFEAWVYVNIEEISDSFPLLKGFEKAKGILTWENSD